MWVWVSFQLSTHFMGVPVWGGGLHKVQVHVSQGSNLRFCWLVSSNLLSDDDKYDLTYLRSHAADGRTS